MISIANLVTAYPLVLLSAVEMGMPFVRMVALTRLLDLKEVGFASVLIATITFLDLATDIAIHRFVYSVPKEQFETALASAHALFVLRGLALAALTLCAAPLIAWALSLGADWGSFAALAPVIVLRSFEHLGVRVAERDYNYWPQLSNTTISSVLSVAVLAAVAVTTRNHVAIIAALYAQAVATLIATRVFAEVPYRIDFRSPLFVRAFRFSYPLMFNGLGLAVSQTADRFIVAGVFNLATLAVYSVVVLVTTLPINMIFRIIGTTVMARFYHAFGNESAFHDQIRFTSSLMALLGAFYTGGVIFLTNTIVPLVFGPKFVIGHLAVVFLGVTAFVRIVRSDPFTALMLTSGRTKRLAASNLIVTSSLFYIIVFAAYSTQIESIFAARLCGEITSFLLTFHMARRVPEGGRFVFSLSSLLGVAFVSAACVASYLHWKSGGTLVLSWMEFATYTMGIVVWGVVLLMRSRKQWTPAPGGHSKI